jgi:hypothetical protein
VLGLFGLTNAALSNTPTPAQVCLLSINLWNRSELYFGSGKPDGSSVIEKQFP